MQEEESFLKKCERILIQRWTFIQSEFAEDKTPCFVDSLRVINEINEILDSKIKSYHYVLPTQLLCKTADFALDCRSLQKAFSSPGAFDARTIAHKVIVPFDKNNYNVLGGSNEPYVNNPLRYPGVTKEYREQQKNKKDWDIMTRLLAEVEGSASKDEVQKYLDQVLTEIHKRLANVKIVYPTPNRVSLKNTIALIEEFLSEKSGGDRLETLVVALFQTIGTEFQVFDRVERAAINASDTSTGMVADIECYKNGKILIGVEVKDQSLSLTQFESIIDTARANKVSEILFIAQKGIKNTDQTKMEARIDQEFTSGQNVYVKDFLSFTVGILALFGEKGRVSFLHKVGPELDRVRSEISNRRKWAELLKNA